MIKTDENTAESNGNMTVVACATPEKTVGNSPLRTAGLPPDTADGKAVPVASHDDPQPPPQKSPGGDESPDPPLGNQAAHLEVIGGFRVHPFASKFPLLFGQAFDDLVESIRVVGVASHVELHDGMLIDGRNRVRAVEELRRQGLEIPLHPVEWNPCGDETVEEHIFALNVYRRHLTDDQRAVLATELLPAIRAARAAAQAATRFGGSGRDTAATNSGLPVGTPLSPRSRRTRAESSTAGQIAKLAKVSPHKAAQAVRLADAVREGTVAPEAIDAVVHGRTLLRHATPTKKKSPPKKGLSPKSTGRTGAEMLFDAPRETDTESVATPATAPSFEYEVRGAWEQLKRGFDETNHRALRSIVMKLIDDEQRAFDN